MPIKCPHCASEDIKIRKISIPAMMAVKRSGICNFCGRVFPVDDSEGELKVSVPPANQNLSKAEAINLFRVLKTHAEMAVGCTSDREAIKFMAAGFNLALSVLEGRTDIKKALAMMPKEGTTRFIRMEGQYENDQASE